MSYARAVRRQEGRPETQTMMDIHARAEAMQMAKAQMELNQQQQMMQIAALCMQISANRDKYLADSESPYALKIVERADEILHDFLSGLKRADGEKD